MRALAPMLILLASATAFAAEIDIKVVARQEKARALDRSEWELHLSRTFENPFDPDEVSIDVRFTPPGKGDPILMPAFWSQPFKDNRFGHHETLKATPDGKPCWLVRFCAPRPGNWSMQVLIRDRQNYVELPAIEFDVAPAPPKARGFVRCATDNDRYFQFEDGSPFFPIGLNIAWPHAEPGLEDYEKWFKSLADAGGNFARIWMSHPNRMTETTDAGIGRFDLSAMHYYDEVVVLAEKHGIYLMVCFNNHRDLLARDQYGESIWGRFPYNAANGGPATRPADFITSPEAREFYKRRLRYVVARYSAFSNIVAWEFFNEQEFTRIDVTTDWMREMSEYLKQIDPYQHLVTTSAKVPDEQYALDTIDLTQAHLYVGGSADVIGPVVNSARRHDKFDKPHVVAELGIGEGHDTDLKRRDTGTSIHNSIWAATMSGCAGSSWHWWWDNYVEPKDLWHVYAGLSRFAAAVDWPRRKFEPIDLPPPQIPAGSGSGERFDLKLACTETWGYKVDGDVVVQPNGRMNQALPHYFVSPMKEDLYAPVRLNVELERPTTVVLRVSRVCDVGVLRVLVDDEPLADFPFSALPGSTDVKQTRQRPREPGRPIVYEAELGVERRVEIPAGKHVVGVTTIAGDWISIESITFRDAQSSRNQLATLALQDSSAGETIAWIYDTRSHWQSDRDGVEPRRFEGVELTVPMQLAQTMRAQWWDTRTGAIVSEEDVTPAGGAVKLAAPAFQRDVALRVYPATGN